MRIYWPVFTFELEVYTHFEKLIENYLSTQIHKYTNTNTQIHKDTKTQQKIKDDLQNWILIAQMNCVAREANKLARKKTNATCEFP